MNSFNSSVLMCSSSSKKVFCPHTVSCGMDKTARDILRSHGIDPDGLIAVDLERIAAAASRVDTNDVSPPPQTIARQGAPPAAALRFLKRPTAAGAVASGTALEAQPTSINIPTHAYYRSVVERADQVLHCREVVAVTPVHKIMQAGDARLVSDEQVERDVRHALQERAYNALPVLDELDRDLQIQKVALERHARFQELCEQKTLFPLPVGYNVPRLC